MPMHVTVFDYHKAFRSMSIFFLAFCIWGHFKKAQKF